MTFPLINRTYEYDGEKYILWQQSLFRKVFCRSLIDNDSKTKGSTYIAFNWWKFMLKAKFIAKIENTSNAY